MKTYIKLLEIIDEQLNQKGHDASYYKRLDVLREGVEIGYNLALTTLIQGMGRGTNESSGHTTVSDISETQKDLYY